jgi:hypothetical protein
MVMAISQKKKKKEVLVKSIATSTILQWQWQVTIPAENQYNIRLKAGQVYSQSSLQSDKRTTSDDLPQTKPSSTPSLEASNNIISLLIRDLWSVRSFQGRRSHSELIAGELVAGIDNRGGVNV